MVVRSLQFHAEPRELLFELLPRWLGDAQRFYMVEWKYNASELVGLPRFTYPDHLSPSMPVDDLARVVVSDRPWIEGHGTIHEVADANQAGSALWVMPGGHHHGGLQQTFMSGSMSHAFKAAKADLLAGAVFTNRAGRHPDPKYRYSAGALTLFRQGAPMFATDYRGNRYELGVSA